MRTVILGFFIVSTFYISAQTVKGKVVDKQKEPLIGVRVETDQNHQARTDLDGEFTISNVNFPVQIKLNFIGYEETVVNLEMETNETIEIELSSAVKEVEGIVVSASRREQRVEEVPVSLEIIKPQLIENKGLVNVEEAVNQAPGAYAMDGQISIRGGSGFSYGAGSRSMVVWNDVPLLSGDAGDAKWQSIPLENISQIEVLKGASSVLYGSGALNGIVSLKDKEPSKDGETTISYQTAIFDRPKREGLRWNDKPLFTNQINAFHGKMHDKFGYTVSAYGLLTDGHRAGEIEERVRLNATTLYKIAPRVNAGLNFSWNEENRGLFIVWENDSLGYNPQNGVEDPFSDSSSLTVNNARRVIIDPYVKWYDENDNKHYFQNRVYHTLNQTEGTNQSASAYVFYSDYKFERKFDNDLVLISGLTGTWNTVDSDLYGSHNSQNYAVYSQLEKRFGRFILTGGVRAEYFQQNDLRADSYTYLSDSAIQIPVRPIFRLGSTYQLLEHTHLRASGGQAFRYPSVAERFASTSVGALNIFPNPDLRPESGWSAEVGIKQGFKIKNFKGFIDVSAFINEYDNMMEFTFGYYEPDSVDYSLPDIINDPTLVTQWFGFRAENAERARISGAEISINGKGSIGPVEITTIMGYTYMNPISLNRDSSYIYGDEFLGGFVEAGGFSDTSTNMLKYRFNHLVKGDIQIDYKNFSLGFSGRYNSFMRNIDGIFEQSIGFQGEEVEVLPGLREYRERNNQGDIVFDARIGFRFNEKFLVHAIVNNIFNREYMTRPGDIRAPRQFMLRFQANL